MNDPLNKFGWASLYQLYDQTCAETNRFISTAQALDCFTERPNSDRALYYLLLDKVRDERHSLGYISLSTYKAILYWKLYSTSPKINNDIEKDIKRQGNISEKLSKSLLYLREFPEQIKKDTDTVLNIISRMLALQLYGMKLPVCTTVLHFMYPTVVPIFDRMVLQAINILDKHANQNIDVLREYLPFAWELADRYAQEISNFTKESPIRVIDMALWVSRGKEGL